MNKGLGSQRQDQEAMTIAHCVLSCSAHAALHFRTRDSLRQYMTTHV